MEKLALYGGTPVRTAPWPSNLLGSAAIDEAELNELKDVIAEQSPFRHYGIGHPNKVNTLEEKLRTYYGRKFALAVTSGSAALQCAMVALGVGPGDEVILSDFTWYSDYYSIVNVGALPVFADIDETLCLDPEDFERKITPRTKAVIVVNFQGGSAKMDRICEIAHAHGIKIIEDCAQAMGCRNGDKLLGTYGDITVLSFQLYKVLSAGEGGALIMDDEKYFVRAVRYHDVGFVREHFLNQLSDKSLANDEENFASCEFRMSELTGAFLVAQFGKLDKILSTCRASHRRIREHFKDNKHFKIRYTEGDCGMAVCMFFNTPEEADKFNECLTAEGLQIGPASACCNLLHKYPVKSRKLAHEAMMPFGKGCYAENVPMDAATCPNTDKILARYLAISIGYRYGEQEINDIITAVDKVCAAIYGEDK